MPPDAHHLQGPRLRVREGDCMAMGEFAALALEGDPDAKAFLMFYRTVDTGHVE